MMTPELAKPKRSRGSAAVLLMVVVAAVVLAAGVGQASQGSQAAPGADPTSSPSAAGNTSGVSSTVDDPGSADAQTGQPLPEGLPPTPAEQYGLWVIAPPVVAILLAILMRSAIPALAIGVLVGAFMMLPCQSAGARLSGNSVLSGIRLAFEGYLLQSIVKPNNDGVYDHTLVILFTLIIGAMVGVIAVNGGTRAMVEKVSRFASTGRRGQLTAWLAGMVVFFDDYANSMIIGPTMRPIFDKLKVSRAKLAYIVDSTAAPVASIALIGTWIGIEVSYIGEGLSTLRSGGTEPGFLSGVTAQQIFVQSIPYRFYAIFALWLVFVIALTGRDFGPMKRSERRVLVEPPEDSETVGAGDTGASRAQAKRSGAMLGVVPILMLVFVTLGVLYGTGRAAAADGGFGEILKHADPYLSILYGAIAAIFAAMVLTVITRACSIRAAVDGAVDGMGHMLPAVTILLLAWALSAVAKDLSLGQVLSGRMIDNLDSLPDWLPIELGLPVAVFLCAAFVSFATGSSWTTMAIMTPIVIKTGAEMGAALEASGGPAVQMFYAAVGAVLAGSVFGDHCSPISDTTVLSSVASGCRVEEHVWTQMPYALLAAIVAVGAGNVCVARYGLSVWWALLAGAGALLAIVFLIGRRPKAPPAPMPAVSQARVHRRVTEMPEPPATIRGERGAREDRDAASQDWPEPPPE